MHRLDEIARPLPDMLVDAPDVFADEAEAEEHDAGEEELQDVAVPEGAQRTERLAGEHALQHHGEVYEDRNDRHADTELDPTSARHHSAWWIYSNMWKWNHPTLDRGNRAIMRCWWRDTRDPVIGFFYRHYFAV